MKKTILFFTCSMSIACNEGTHPSLLDHATILAVRAEPPRINAGEKARIDVLVSTAEGTPELIETPAIAVALPDERAPEMVEMNEGGSFVIAPPDEAIAAIRAAQGLPEDAPVPVSIDLSVTISGVEKAATKMILLGDTAQNPTIGALVIDGTEYPEGPVFVPVGTKPRIGVVASGDGELTYAWYSSVGELDFYRSQTMTLDAIEAKSGRIVVVVRDASGGASHRIYDVTVE
jgi:hypothetical protein